MIVSIVTFKLPRPWSVAEAAAIFQSTAPKYLGKPGLIRKHYYVTEAGDRAGGIYLWESKAAAEACYSRRLDGHGYREIRRAAWPGRWAA
jgi:hypothetical protein